MAPLTRAELTDELAIFLKDGIHKEMASSVEAIRIAVELEFDKFSRQSQPLLPRVSVLDGISELSGNDGNGIPPLKSRKTQLGRIQEDLKQLDTQRRSSKFRLSASWGIAGSCDSEIYNSTPLEESIKGHQPPIFDIDTAGMQAASAEIKQDDAEMPLMYHKDTSSLKASSANTDPLRHLTVICGFMVLLNVLSVGLDTNDRLVNRRKESSWLFHLSEICFCIFFAGEITTRVSYLGASFFLGDQRGWNLFDFFLVGLQVFEQLTLALCAQVTGKSNLTFLRILRVLRLVRCLRLVRLLHLFDQLRQIVDSMMTSVPVLIWSIVMLFLVIYLFSIVFLQCILDSENWHDLIDQEDLHHYFSSMARTIFTMFECVVGGVNWDDVATPLMRNISPYLGVLFSVYVAFCMFAIMNMLTGVFVDQAMQCVKEDKDYVVASQLKDLFFAGEDHQEYIDWYTFESKLQSSVLQDFLHEVGLSVSEARGLFHLLDENHSGTLSSAEIVEGCLRLRGPARALDLCLLMREMGIVRSEIEGWKQTTKGKPRLSRFGL